MTKTITPKIYVADLAAYNAGKLRGIWIDAAQEPDEIRAEVQAMLAGSPEPVKAGPGTGRSTATRGVAARTDATDTTAHTASWRRAALSAAPRPSGTPSSIPGFARVRRP
jgi:hypothetical protein